MKILVVEDDKNTRDGLVEIFSKEGYETLSADNGEKALSAFKMEKPDIICLDIMMPNINGYDVCREIRKSNTDIPILFISAKSEEIDKVLGLELGADDYIIKPFGVKEVVARIRAVTRRYFLSKTKVKRPPSFNIGDILVVPHELRVYRDNNPINISLRDIKILTLFHERKGNVLDRNTIFDICWNLDYIPNSRTLDQHISQLRKKIEIDPKSPKIIQTVQGVGYRFEE